ncbi:MAG TPA: TetR family transcriptional regulator, partial [Caulobacteraceae bacterium]
NGLDRLLAFVDLALNADRPEPAVLSEVAYLDGDQRETIEALHAGNLAQLQRLIERAQADGSARAGHPLVIAQAVIGMVSWIPLAPRWSGDDGGSVRAQAQEGLRILLTDGIATDPARALDYMPLDLDVLRPERGGAFDRDSVAAMKLEELLRAASRLFNRKGVEATSVDEIAAEVGATKGVVYHYLADKPDLVARCYRRAFDMADRVLAAVERANGSGIEKSLQGLRLLVEINLRDEFCPLAPLAGFEALPASAREALTEQVRGTEVGFPDIARQGIADGSVRDVDLQAVAITMAGAFGWLHKWYSPDIVPPQTVIDEHVKLMARGLRRQP